MEEFHKVRRLPPYVFEQVNRLKASARAEGRDIIDLGMGNPDLPTPTNHRRQAGARRCAIRARTAIRPRRAFRGCARRRRITMRAGSA
jgi:aspartate/methionine/tyrosine aminotransferase